MTKRQMTKRETIKAKKLKDLNDDELRMIMGDLNDAILEWPKEQKMDRIEDFWTIIESVSYFPSWSEDTMSIMVKAHIESIVIMMAWINERTEWTNHLCHNIFGWKKRKTIDSDWIRKNWMK